MSRSTWAFLGVALVTLVAAPWLVHLAGDAQVHLAVADNFAAGRPFQYNPTGEMVVASTSPFWTMLLALFYRVAGDSAPLLLSLTVVVFWLADAYVLYVAARRSWGLPGLAVAVVVGLWLLHTTIVANALGGLENILSALQLLLLYVMTSDYLRSPGAALTPKRSALLGVVVGWALLTRPDGGLLALGLLGIFGLALWPPLDGERFGRDLGALVGQLAIIGGVALLVLAPWYLYQYTLTGQLVTDSSLARLYNGRLGSLMLIPDTLYLHPKTIVSLASAFAPLAAGLPADGMGGGRRVVAGAGRAAGPVPGGLPACCGRRAGRRRRSLLHLCGRCGGVRPLLPASLSVPVSGGRGGLGDGRRLAASARAATMAVGLVALAVAFMATTSLYDAYRRLGPGRFISDGVLAVIYGPANRQYFSANLPALLTAPAERATNTAELRADLGASNGPFSIAVTEVQLRYFVDETVEVLSLDGRTSADILTYVNPTNGVPDFEQYLNDARPDYVHAAQWCEVGGWLADLLPARIDDNLICVWEQQAAGMATGDSFVWEGHPVTLVAPQILRVDWTAAP